MPEQVQRFDVYLPIAYNDGRPIEDEKFKWLEDLLLERFGGVTCVQRAFPFRGLWRTTERIYEDRVVVMTVLVTAGENVEPFFSQLKDELRAVLRQAEILITSQTLRIV